MTRHELVGGQVLKNVHAPSACKHQSCCIHNPSDHHMAHWPQNWRDDRKIMERVCQHGIGHPDPDDITNDTVHGCDGCCTPPTATLNNTVVADSTDEATKALSDYIESEAARLPNGTAARYKRIIEEGSL